MDIKDRLSFYKSQYDSELARKTEVMGVVQVRLVSFLSAVGVMLYMLKTFQLEHSLELVPIVFVVSATISCICFLYIAWVLYRAYWGDTYERLPPVSEMERYFQDMKEAGIINEKPDAFTEYLIEEIGVCVNNNIEKNDSRYQVMNKVMKRLPWALCPFLLAGGIYLGADLDTSSPRKAISVQIVDRDE
ncbi:hypothetical protein [Grimontia sp. SpTr1]|uniref:hypothetical protein n=1 Tax=Grimontia sp. SpTr1 TaxID=2995319 RepID=UPI00248CAE25|nr:hypothetical protein [Grimontia sp. SpTr1]